ncbi:hypothetical protein CR513_19763, partial [Mucuna pruriens]
MTRTMLNCRNSPKPILKKTSYELRKGRQPNIYYFHPFGCERFILNTKDNLEKFDPMFDKGTFLGYSDLFKAYKVYNFRTLTIEEFIHLKFNDSKPDKELLEMNDSFTYMILDGLQTLSKETHLDEEPKDNKMSLPKGIRK